MADNLLKSTFFIETEEEIDQFMWEMYDTYEGEQYVTYDVIKAYLNPLTRPFVIIEEDE
ncbi:hypothetical protein [Melissococcus plutonius]|uniref:hypothetical protein n=1 Tax=Melissococcus plutonius TaxID=33970 RepID=UPI0021E6211C|nr:hypothetical protein [Melissococcus plutonius]